MYLAVFAGSSSTSVHAGGHVERARCGGAAVLHQAAGHVLDPRAVHLPASALTPAPSPSPPPGGPDVYGGIRIDYRGQDVTAATFLAVLEGNASAVAGLGSGRVAASGPHDRLFVFYSDHGAPGVLGMPAGGWRTGEWKPGAGRGCVGRPKSGGGGGEKRSGLWVQVPGGVAARGFVVMGGEVALGAWRPRAHRRCVLNPART